MGCFSCRHTKTHPGSDGGQDCMGSSQVAPFGSSPSLEELVTAGRSVCAIHYYLRLKQIGALKYIDPEIRKHIIETHGDRWLRFKLLLTILAVAALPYVYANTVMTDPCNPQPWIEVNNNTHYTFREAECSFEDLLKEPRGGLLIGGVFALAGVVSTVFQCAVATILTKLSKRSDLWLKISYWHAYLVFHILEDGLIKSMMPRLSYSNAIVMILPCVNVRVSLGAAVTTGFLVLVIQFAALTVATRQWGVGCIVGYGVLQFYSYVVNFLLSQDRQTICIVNSEIRAWRCGAGADPFLKWMMEEPSYLCMPTPALMQIAAIDTESNYHRGGVRYLATQIYLTDQNLLLDVFNRSLSQPFGNSQFSKLTR